MRLIYSPKEERCAEGKKPGDEVAVGDRVNIARADRGETEAWVTVDYFRKPHKTSSEGKISVKYDGARCTSEYYVGIIGAEWVEREDRAAEDAELSANWRG